MPDPYAAPVSECLRLAPLKGPALVPVVPPLPDFEQVLGIMAGHGDPGAGLTAAAPPAAVPGSASPVDDLASPDVPNLLVRVFLQSCRHTVLQGDGVNSDALGRVVMTWSGNRADDVFFRDEFEIAAPGEELNYPAVHGIYRAIVFDGCLSSDAFPIAVSAVIDIAPGIQLGAFSASDDDTIRPGGRWAFEFDVRANRDEGASQSEFRFRGAIDAICTSLADSDPFAG